MNKFETKNLIRSKKTFYLLLVVFIGLTLIYQARPYLNDTQFAWISVPAYSIIPGFLSVSAGILAAKLSKIKHYQAKAFLLFAIGAGSWFVAEQIWAVYDHVFNQDPFPSEADIFYLVAYPFYFIFLIIILKPIRQHISKKILFVSVIISGSLLFPALSFVAIDYQDDLSPEFLIALVYPILGSVLLVPVIIGILFLFKKRANYSWMLLLFGFITYSVADTVFMFTVLEEQYYDGHPVDLLYLYGIIFLSFSVMERIRSFPQDKNMIDSEFYSERIRYETISQFGIPLIVVIIMISVIVSTVSTLQHSTSSEGTQFLLLGIIVLMGVFSGIIFLLNFSLKKLVSHRTTELEQQKDELEELIEEKTQKILRSERLSAIGELAGSLSHDLRNPLSLIKMSVDLIKQNPPHTKLSDEKVSQKLNLIEKGIDRISHQIDDVLSFVRVSPLQTTYESLRNAILSSVGKINVPSNVKINVKENDIKTFFDPATLDAVFTNIILNAIQAMPKGGQITISIKSKGDFVVIDFENTGDSIPEENIETIFEPLFTTKQEGTGLGLASCKNIVEQHGGVIYAKNNPTTFTIKLPKKSN